MPLSDTLQNCIGTDYKSLLDVSRNIGTSSIQTHTWYGDSLTLYDIFWSLTVALIQVCMLRQGRSNQDMRTSAASSNADADTLQNILGTKYQLRRHTCPSSEMADAARATEQLKLVLLQDILPTCSEEECQCFQVSSSIVQNAVRSPKHT